MKGLNLIKQAFALEAVDRVPWVPFVGVHGGNLLNLKADEYLKSSEHLYNGAAKAMEFYKPDGLPVVFDLQIEAEALGCQLAWSEENPPAVVSHPLAEGKNLKELDLPSKTDGRIPIALEATALIRKTYPETALYGLITGPFTLALHLLGTDIFMKMFEDPNYVNELMTFCNEVAKKMSDWYIEAGCDIIAVVDPMTSQIDPMSFETFVSPLVTELFSHIRDKDKLSSFFVCGQAQQNIEVMCKCKPDNVSIDENIPLDYVKDIALQNGVSFGGNLKLTTVLLMGTPEDCQRDAIECLDLAGKKGFVLAPGCDLPMVTPRENLEAVAELVHDPYTQDVVRALEKKEVQMELPDLSTHWDKEKVVVDIITLDSSSCAPCQYMVEAVKHAGAAFGDKLLWKEYKIKDETGVKMMMALGVKNIPTICIDGEVSFISQIPPRQELERAIQAHLDKKAGQ